MYVLSILEEDTSLGSTSMVDHQRTDSSPTPLPRVVDLPSIQYAIQQAGFFHTARHFDAPKPRKPLAVYNKLEEVFNKNWYISQDEKDALSKQLNLTPRQIKFWFQNRRAKAKKSGVMNQEYPNTESE